MKAEQLRKSILQLAIQGKLVPQNPADEPASVLLERIRVEKQKLIKEGKIKKDKTDSIIFKGDDNRHYEKVGKEVKDVTEEIPFDIPDSWVFYRLETITYPVGNKNNQLQTKEFLKEGKYPVISQGQNLIDGYTNYIDKLIAVNQPIVMFGDHTRNVKYIDFSFVIGADGTKFFAPILFNSKFLYFTVLYFSHTIANRGYARHYSLLKSAYLPLPPLAEQARIVAEIEKYEPLIAEYDKLEKESAKLDGEIKDKLKKSILQYAIQGKLVPQDEADEPASALLEKIRAEKRKQLGKKYVDSYIYKGDDNCYYEHINGKDVDITDKIPFDLPNNWCWVRLDDLALYRKGPFGSSLTKDMFVPKSDTSVKVYEQKNAIQKDYTLGTYYITNEKYQTMKSFEVFPNDIIVSCAGTIGETYILPINAPRGIINQALMRIRLFINEIASYYLLYFDYVLKVQAQESSKGSAIRNIPPFDILKKMLIPIPPLAEQKRIVAKIDEIFDKL